MSPFLNPTWSDYADASYPDNLVISQAMPFVVAGFLGEPGTGQRTLFERMLCITPDITEPTSRSRVRKAENPVRY